MEWKQKDTAEAFRVALGEVSKWMKKAREEGIVALRQRPTPGPMLRLNPEQWTRLATLLVKKIERFSFGGTVWMHKRVERIFKALGWSRQKLVKRTSQEDKEANKPTWNICRVMFAI